MLSCWIEDPNMRPSFAQLHTTLGQLATKDKVSMKCPPICLFQSECINAYNILNKKCFIGQ